MRAQKSIDLNINMLDISNMVLEMYNIMFEIDNKGETLMMYARRDRRMMS